MLCCSTWNVFVGALYQDKRGISLENQNIMSIDIICEKKGIIEED